jgi:hypothetical protein
MSGAISARRPFRLHSTALDQLDWTRLHLTTGTMDDNQQDGTHYGKYDNGLRRRRYATLDQLNVRQPARLIHASTVSLPFLFLTTLACMTKDTVSAQESETREYGRRERHGSMGDGKTRATGSKVIRSGVFTTLARVR